MKTDTYLPCTACGSTDIRQYKYKRYLTLHNGYRLLLECNDCHDRFSETTGSPMENIKSPISKVALALKMRGEGLGLCATGRVLGSDKHTITRWEERFADQKSILMLYVLCHEFISLTFEGDELYTIVGKRTDPSASKGWTAVIIERGRPPQVLPLGGKVRSCYFPNSSPSFCPLVVSYPHLFDQVQDRGVFYGYDHLKN